MFKNKTKCSVRGPVTSARETRRGARRRVPILCFVINQWREDGEGVGPTDRRREDGAWIMSSWLGSGLCNQWQWQWRIPANTRWSRDSAAVRSARTFSQLQPPFCTWMTLTWRLWECCLGICIPLNWSHPAPIFSIKWKFCFVCLLQWTAVDRI